MEKDFFYYRPSLVSKLSQETLDTIIKLTNLLKDSNLKELKDIFDVIKNHRTYGMLPFMNDVENILESLLDYDEDKMGREYKIVENYTFKHTGDEVTIPFGVAIINETNPLITCWDLDDNYFSPIDYISKDYLTIEDTCRVAPDYPNENSIKRKENETLEDFIKRSFENIDEEDYNML